MWTCISLYVLTQNLQAQLACSASRQYPQVLLAEGCGSAEVLGLSCSYVCCRSEVDLTDRTL